MKKLIIGIMCTAMAAAILSGCGDSSSANGGGDILTPPTTSAAQDESSKAGATEETDFMSAFFKSGGVQYMGMTPEEISDKTGGAFDKKNAIDSYGDYDTYSLGKKSELFGGKLKLGGEYPVKCSLIYKDGKLAFISYVIGDDDSSGDAKDVAKTISDFFKENLPEDNKYEADVPVMGKGSSRFFNGKEDGYIFTVQVSTIGSTAYPVTVKVGDYKHTYGIK